MALIGHLDRLQRRAARAHRFDRCGRQNVGIGAADHHQRAVAERVELRPERREGLLEIDAFQRLGELDVIGRHQGAVFLAEGAVGAGEPILVRELGKLVVKQPAQDLGAFLEGSRLRQLANIALDPHQPRRLDYRTDVVEHAACDRGRPQGGKQHRQDAAARGANEDRAGRQARS